MVLLNIGRTIKEIRNKKRITITQLCEGTGLSPGFLSRIENDKTSPSLHTLNTIADYLNVPITYLLLEKEDRMEIVRGNNRKQCTMNKGNVKIEHLNMQGFLKMRIVEMPVGAESGEKPHFHPGEECHYVISGKLFVQQGEDTAIVEEGDSFKWNAAIPHYVKNIGEGPCKLIIAVYSEDESQYKVN